jgi:hypothetical protein
MERYVLNSKCCLCSFLDRPRENIKNAIKYNQSLADIRTGHLSSTNRKHCRLSKLANLRYVISTNLTHAYCTTRLLVLLHVTTQSYCSLIKICRSCLSAFFQLPYKSSDLGPSTRWFKYDRDWFFCKQAALRCASKCLVIKVFKKKNQSRSYLNHLVFSAK